ncbi:MAG: hypothetical protein QM757_14645 [Paludibaculum sp.]
MANDPHWRNGDYYDAAPGGGPHAGLALARQIAQIHYRSEVVFEQRFGRTSTNPIDHFAMWDRFEVESYLQYHGEKLVRRFDANSYLVLNQAMDLHDIGRGRGGTAQALRRIEVPTCTMSIPTDTLYPPYQQEALRDGLVAVGVPVEHVVIDSPHGHDGFLLEFEQVGSAIGKFLRETKCTMPDDHDAAPASDPTAAGAPRRAPSVPGGPTTAGCSRPSRGPRPRSPPRWWTTRLPWPP